MKLNSELAVLKYRNVGLSTWCFGINQVCCEYGPEAGIIDNFAVSTYTLCRLIEIKEAIC